MSTRFRLTCRSAAFATLASLMLVPAPARALPAIAAFETVGFQNNLASENRTLGWIFTTLDTIIVSSLGVWDEASDGLVAAHMVGIWGAGGSLRGVATVQAGTASPIDGAPTGGGSFRYELVSPIFLGAGRTFTIGALYENDDIFEYNADDVTTGAAIAFGEERYSEEGDGFIMPTGTFSRAGLFGPNFQYTVVVSEPAAAALFGLGLAGLICAGRRRQRCV
jgi:hypothetical protein